VLRKFVLLNVVFGMILIPLTVHAQVASGRDPVPLRNWPAAQHWAPSGSELSFKMSGGLQAEAHASINTAATESLDFIAITPCRVVDTRPAYSFPVGFGAPALGAGETRTFLFRSNTSPCPLSSSALAYSATLTVVPKGPLGYLTVYPTGPRPMTATLNSTSGAIVNNALVVAGGNGGSIDVFATDATDVIIVLNGY